MVVLWTTLLGPAQLYDHEEETSFDQENKHERKERKKEKFIRLGSLHRKTKYIN